MKKHGVVFKNNHLRFTIFSFIIFCFILLSPKVASAESYEGAKSKDEVSWSISSYLVLDHNNTDSFNEILKLDQQNKFRVKITLEGYF